MVGGSTATNHFCHNHQPKMSIIPLSEGVGQKRNSGLRPRDSLIIIALQRPAAGGEGCRSTSGATKSRRGRDSCKGPSGERKGKENLQPPQLPILHPIRAEPLNHIAYLTHKYFCSYKKL